MALLTGPQPPPLRRSTPGGFFSFFLVLPRGQSSPPDPSHHRATDAYTLVNTGRMAFEGIDGARALDIPK